MSVRILRENAHLTYPHGSGFRGERILLSAHDPATGRDTGIIDASDGHVLWGQRGDAELVWFDCAGDLLATASGGSVEVLDLSAASPVSRVLFEAPEGSTLDGLLSVRPDGLAVAVVETTGERRRLLEVDVASGEVTEMCAVDWWANHVVYSPFDPTWVGFAHEGPTLEIPDRMWAWHPAHGPAPFLDQRAIADRPGSFVAVGHERWLHHDLGAIVVAYGASEAGPRGLYVAHPDGRPPKLVSAGERFWHCDVSRDGRFAVVDTKGPFDLPGRAWPDREPVVSDVVLVELSTGELTRLARTHGHNHPKHPHPVFAPDGTSVLFNHTDEDRATVNVASVRL